MFLKKLILALLIINLGYFVYSQAWFQTLIGDGDATQREPQRVTKQINAEAILVKPIHTVASPSAAPTEAATTVAARSAEVCTVKREQWVIYMGPYLTQAASNKKRSELKQLGVASTEVSKPTLKIGLSLGQFDTEVQANQALKELGTKGVRTATTLFWATVEAPC